jgi:ribosome-binding factor A
MTRRTDQIGEAVREEVARIIGQGLKDPRIGFVTVTRAEVTPDLRHAKILFGVLGDAAQRDKTAKGLRQAAGFIRREVGKRLRLRYTPELTFQYDVGIEATDRVARLLEETQTGTNETAHHEGTEDAKEHEE